MAEAVEFCADGGESSASPVMIGVPGVGSGDIVTEPIKGPLAGVHFRGGAGDVVAEPFDVVEGGVLVVAVLAAQQRQGSDPVEPVVGVVEPVFRPVVFLLGGAQLVFGSPERPTLVGRGTGEDGFVVGSFGEESLDALGVVVGGEAGVGHTQEGVEDLLVRAALVGEDAAVVDVGEAGDVPGVGGVAASALGGVAGEAFEGGGAEEVDLGPGGALDAVDGAGPGVGQVGGAVAAVTFNEAPA